MVESKFSIRRGRRKNLLERRRRRSSVFSRCKEEEMRARRSRLPFAPPKPKNKKRSSSPSGRSNSPPQPGCRCVCVCVCMCGAPLLWRPSLRGPAFPHQRTRRLLLRRALLSLTLAARSLRLTSDARRSCDRPTSARSSVCDPRESEVMASVAI